MPISREILTKVVDGPSQSTSYIASKLIRNELQLRDLDKHELAKLTKCAKYATDLLAQPHIPQTYKKDRTRHITDQIRRFCLSITLENEIRKLPSDNEINRFESYMQTSEHSITEEIEGKATKTISFGALNSVLRTVDKSITRLLQPVSFFRAHFPEWNFQKDCRIPVDTVMEFVSLKASFMRNRIAMAFYDSDSTGFLTREQLSDYYQREVMPLVAVLKDLEETFQICYMNTVETMFFFFLDPKHTGRIRISDALVSGFLENAFGLQSNSEDYECWFSPEKTHEMNAMFQMLDSNHKNYLDKSDFKQILDGTFTQTFVDRLFEVHVTKGGEAMSYEEFVIFQIAYNHLAHPSSIAYFFKVLDVDGDNYLSRFELRFFYTDLSKAYNEWMAIDGAMPEFNDIADQFFDMIKPIQNGKISLQDVLFCKQGHDFILCLINYQEFYRYETRDVENGTGLEQDSAVPLFGESDDEQYEDDLKSTDCASISDNAQKNHISGDYNNNV